MYHPTDLNPPRAAGESLATRQTNTPLLTAFTLSPILLSLSLQRTIWKQSVINLPHKISTWRLTDLSYSMRHLGPGQAGALTTNGGEHGHPIADPGDTKAAWNCHRGLE